MNGESSVHQAVAATRAALLPGPTGEPEEAHRLRVAFFGFGRVGAAALELALTRPWIEPVAAIARRPEREGEPARASVPSAPSELRVRTDARAALEAARPEVVVLATRSRLADVLPHVRICAEAGAHAVVCAAEELACVREDDGPEAAAIHALARQHDMAIVATGVNPGFVLDLWPLVLSGLAWDVERIAARRVVDVSVFAPHVRTNLGIGYTGDGFRAGLADGRILGHLGFPESLRLLCEAMGRPAERIAIETHPVMAERRFELADGVVEPGTSIAASQRAEAWVGGAAWIAIELLLHAAPGQAGIRTTDETHLFGRHELHVTVDPGCGAVLSTAALLVNAIPAALRARAGVHGPGDLPPVAPWLGSRPPMAARG